MNSDITESDVAALKREHSSLDDEIAEWREWWGQLRDLGDPHFGEMGDRLAQFREHLAAHFAHEESQGCLSLVMELPDNLVKRIAELRDEHPKLLGELDQLISQLQQCDPQLDCWGKAREEFEGFLDQLNTHEEAEDAFLDQLS
ncbi:MAG: hemerythrin domain-containing protein [Planctomycetaceae bacterium]|nr:hemerythrin domain-containing protein [Planctomycetaceae bacterium]